MVLVSADELVSWSLVVLAVVPDEEVSTVEVVS